MGTKYLAMFYTQKRQSQLQWNKTSKNNWDTFPYASNNTVIITDIQEIVSVPLHLIGFDFEFGSSDAKA